MEGVDFSGGNDYDPRLEVRTSAGPGDFAHPDGTEKGGGMSKL
jgi:hypothetical protein